MTDQNKQLNSWEIHLLLTEGFVATAKAVRQRFPGMGLFEAKMVIQRYLTYNPYAKNLEHIKNSG